MLKAFAGGLSAGILISIGGSVFLSCDNRYVGAVLFAMALLCICCKGYVLFTGKVGYLAESHTAADFRTVLVGLVGNLAATVLIGMLIRWTIPALGETAQTMCAAKLTQTSLQTFIRAVFCGVLMYLAVSIYKEKNTPLAICFCVPVFILSGFEHSIADAFYFGASGLKDWKIVLFLVMVLLGNSLGGLLLPWLKKLEGKNG